MGYIAKRLLFCAVTLPLSNTPLLPTGCRTRCITCAVSTKRRAHNFACMANNMDDIEWVLLCPFAHTIALIAHIRHSNITPRTKVLHHVRQLPLVGM